MALGSFWGKFAHLLTGGAVATAAGEAVMPVLEAVKQHAWQQRAIRTLEPRDAAAVTAERMRTPIDAADDAKRHGIGVARFHALVELELQAPGSAAALDLWRRGRLTKEEARAALHKNRLREDFVEPMLELFNDRLDPAVIATAVQRGVLRNEGLLPVGPPVERGKVPPMPVVDLDPLEEAQASGVDFDRLAVMARIVGLPPGAGELLQLLNRGVITEIDYQRGIAEGNTRNEWAPFLRELARRLLTPHEYAELRLRGWIDDEAMYAGAALSGLSREDTELLRLMLGRPLSFHQVFVGQRRGGRYDGPTAGIDPAFLKSLQESNIRPEWYHLAWAQRYSYPSAFVLRALTSSGELTAAESERILLYVGWEPDLARKVAARWAGGRGGAAWEETRAELADEYEGGYLTEQQYREALTAHGVSGAALEHLVHLGDARRNKRYREKVIDAIGKAYMVYKIDATNATGELAEVGVLGDAAGKLLALWGKERRAGVRLLTPAQIRAAFKRKIINRADALEELDHLGYGAEDASDYLAL